MRGPAPLVLGLLGLFACTPAPPTSDVWLDDEEPDDPDVSRILQVGPGEADLPQDDDDIVGDDDDQAAVCEDDHFEDNDHPGEALPLEPGVYPFLVLCDPDHFVLDLQAGDTLRVDLGFDGSEGQPWLQLSDPAGVPLDLDDARLEGITLEVVVDVSGPWTLELDLAEDLGEVPGVGYSLSIDVTGLECDPGAFEPNDSDLAPWPMEAGGWSGLRVCPFEDDFFAVWLEPTDAVEASIDFDPQEGDLALSLFGPSLVPLDGAAGVAGTASVGATATASGWHVLWVELVADSGQETGVAYELAIALP